jgi:hypothetical protein
MCCKDNEKTDIRVKKKKLSEIASKVTRLRFAFSSKPIV